MASDRCIVTAADSNYFPALMALLRSLRRTNPHLPVIVFDGGLSRGQAKRAGRFSKVIPKEPSIKIDGRGKFSYISNTSLLKFEVTDLSHEKVLFLDADMVVLEKLDELFLFPETSVGVVPEVNSVKNMFRIQHRETLAKSLDIDLDETGFNGGLFALRPREWKGLPERARALMDRFGEDFFSKSKDQQLLNIIFSGKTHYFPARYNFSPFYDNAEDHRPAIIHYLTRCKPWHYGFPLGHYYEKFRNNISARDYPGILLVDMVRGLKRFFTPGPRSTI